MRPIELVAVNQRLPSAPGAMSLGRSIPEDAMTVEEPPVVTWTILSLVAVIQRLPSGPVVTAWVPRGAPNAPVGNVTVPSVVISPSFPLPAFANQRWPSGPTAIPAGPSMGPPANLVIEPAGVIRSIELLSWLVNQMLPSGAAVMPIGSSMLGSVKSVKVPDGVSRVTVLS